MEVKTEAADKRDKKGGREWHTRWPKSGVLSCPWSSLLLSPAHGCAQQFAAHCDGNRLCFRHMRVLDRLYSNGWSLLRKWLIGVWTTYWNHCLTEHDQDTTATPDSIPPPKCKACELAWPTDYREYFILKARANHPEQSCFLKSHHFFTLLQAGNFEMCSTIHINKKNTSQ